MLAQSFLKVGIFLATLAGAQTPSPTPNPLAGLLGAGDPLLANACSAGVDSENCIRAYANRGEGICRSFKSAEENLKKFKEACSASSYGPAQCMSTAIACYESFEEEEEDFEETQEELRALGLTDFESPEQRQRVCSVMSKKDFEEDKAAKNKSLREARKEMDNLQKDLVRQREQYMEKRKQLVERRSEVQKRQSDLIDQNQKEAQERAQQMAQSIADLEKQQVALRGENISLQAQMAAEQGKRATALADLSDGIIATQCNQQLDALIMKWRAENPRYYKGTAAFLGANSEKRRILKETRDACIYKAQQMRKATRKTYQESLNGIKFKMRGNEQQANRLEQMKGQQNTDYQAFMARQKTSESEAYARATQELAAIDQQAQQTDATNQQRYNEIQKALQEAQTEINQSAKVLDNLPKPPRGTKPVTEAVGPFSSFYQDLKALRDTGNATCTKLANSLDSDIKDDIKAYEAYMKKTKDAMKTKGTKGAK